MPGLLLVLALRRQRREMRRRAFRRLAILHGLSATGGGNAVTDPRFELLRAGYERTMPNLMSGEWHGAEVSLADYAYRESARRWHRFSIAMVEFEPGLGAGVDPGELGLPEGWSVQVIGSAALIHGPMARPDDLGLVLDMADALIAHRGRRGNRPGSLG